MRLAMGAAILGEVCCPSSGKGGSPHERHHLDNHQVFTGGHHIGVEVPPWAAGSGAFVMFGVLPSRC